MTHICEFMIMYSVATRRSKGYDPYQRIWIRLSAEEKTKTCSMVRLGQVINLIKLIYSVVSGIGTVVVVGGVRYLVLDQIGHSPKSHRYENEIKP